MKDFRCRAWLMKEKLMLDWIMIAQSAFNRGNASLLYDLLTRHDKNVVLMQYTGIKLNDQYFYEKDIVTYKLNGMDRKYFVVEDVLWAHREFPMGNLPSIAEVIGDVYRNPGLLELCTNKAGVVRELSRNLN